MSSSPSTPVAKPIPSDSQKDVSRFVDIITHAFSETALTTSFIVAIDSTPPPYPSPLIDFARRRKHFAQGILDSAASGAELVQAGDWSAIALWESPSYQGKTFSESKANPPAVLGEWRFKVKQAKARWLGLPPNSSSSSTTSVEDDSNADSPAIESITDPESVQLRPFYHLSFLARNPAVERVQGSINAVLKPYLDRARAEGVPAWLEATNPQAMRVYQHYGFRVVETIVIGKGKVDQCGWPKEDGEGVTAYAMIFDEQEN
jgi:hypothetical protein